MSEVNISYIAYKNLLLNMAKNNCYDLGRHLSETDYVAFKEHNELIEGIFIEGKDKYGQLSSLIDKYYQYNPKEKENIELAKKLLVNLTSEKDVEKIFNFCGEENFINDYPLIKQITINTEGRFFTYSISEKAKQDYALRDYLYETEGFNLFWFNLPPPETNDLILSSIKTSFHSYRKLTDEQRENKEYLVATIDSLLKGKEGERSCYYNIQSQIYDFVPSSLRKEKDVAEMFAKIGFVSQIKEAYYHNNVLPMVFDSIMSSYVGKPYSASKSNLHELSVLPKDIFENYKNIQSLLESIVKHKNTIKTEQEPYAVIYKLIKNASKNNSYMREAFNRKNSIWNQCNIGQSKLESVPFFDKFFNKSVPEMLEEIKLYIAAEDLRKDLSNKNVIQQKKIKI